MKFAHYLLVLSALFTVPWCRCVAAGDQSFSTAMFDGFRTADFSSFLGTTNAAFRKDNLGGVIFKSRPGYITGGTLESGHRFVGIAVFESHQAAMAAVEWRRKDVAAIIEKGRRERNGVVHWWFGESQALLSIVQGSMVFEVCDLDRRYSDIEDGLWTEATKFLKIADAATSVSPVDGKVKLR